MTEFNKFAQYTNDTLIAAWREKQAQARALAAEEKEMREEVLARFFSTDPEAEGVETIELGAGWKLKATHKLSYSLQTDKLDAAMHALVNSGADGRFIADRLISFTPKLSVREYKNLDAASQNIVNEAVVIKPAAATLQLVEPKVK